MRGLWFTLHHVQRSGPVKQRLQIVTNNINRWDYLPTLDPKSSRNSSFRCENATRWSRARSLLIARSKTVNNDGSSISGCWYSMSISCRYSLGFSCHMRQYNQMIGALLRQSVYVDRVLRNTESHILVTLQYTCFS